MTKFYVVGDCPVCVGSSELVALLGQKNRRIIFYCPSCETAWDKVPEAVDEVGTLNDLSPDGVLAPSSGELKQHGIRKYVETDLYNDLEDILG